MQHRNDGGGVDRPRSGLEQPVAAQYRGTGLVDGGRNISAGHRRDGLDEVCAGTALADVTAIQQDVAICGERTSDARKIHRVLLRQGVRGIGLAGDNQVARTAVADDMDGVNAALPVHKIGHLIQAVTGGVDQYDACVRIADIDQKPLVIGHRDVEEYDFLTRASDGARHDAHLPHIGTGEPGKQVGGGCTSLIPANVSAMQNYLRACVQAPADFFQFGNISRAHARGIEHRRTNADPPPAVTADEMDGINCSCRQLRQEACHLLNGVPGGIEYHHHRTRAYLLQQRLIALHGRIDKHNLRAIACEPGSGLSRQVSTEDFFAGGLVGCRLVPRRRGGIRRRRNA